uniref:hypothetical protein n=1 Tax=Marinobacterium profundum TaxID=1714300 RepID=UPI001C1FDBB1
QHKPSNPSDASACTGFNTTSIISSHHRNQINLATTRRPEQFAWVNGLDFWPDYLYRTWLDFYFLQGMIHLNINFLALLNMYLFPARTLIFLT